MSDTYRIALPLGVIAEITPSEGCVVTVFPDGRRCGATREPTPDNLAQAREQGYPATPDGVWRSLVEHELLHSLVSYELWGTVSPTLRHESGGESAPYWLRLHEESMVLSAQIVRNNPHALRDASPFTDHSRDVWNALYELERLLGAQSGALSQRCKAAGSDGSLESVPREGSGHDRAREAA